MKTKLLSYSYIPTSKIAATVKVLMRGTLPNAVAAPGRDQRDLAAQPEPHPLRHPGADRGGAGRVEAHERALLDVARDHLARLQVGRPNAADDGTATPRRWRWP